MLALREAVPIIGTDVALDRHLIGERIARYCWAFDERQLSLLGECFTEDAVWEGNVLGRTPIGPFVGRDKILHWLSEFWPFQHDQRRHMLLNTIIEEQSPDNATTLSYLLLMSSTGRTLSIEATGFYKTSYRRINEHWQIARLKAGFDKPFWSGDIDKMSLAGRSRHGVASKE
jgi:hypothetical protein